MATYTFDEVPVYDVLPGGALRTVRAGQVRFRDYETDAVVATVSVGANGKASYGSDTRGVLVMETDGGFRRVVFATEALLAAATFGVSEDNAVASILGNSSSASRTALAPVIDARAATKAAEAAAPKVNKGELRINVRDYGAVGDGTTDDTTAIVNAAAAANARRLVTIGGNTYRPGATLFFPPGYTFNLASLSAPILLSCNVEGAGALLRAPQAYGQAVLLVGHETSAQVLHNANIILPDVTKPQPSGDFTAGSVGVQVQNLTHSQVRFGRVTWMETAHWYTGLGQGTVYNSFMPGWVDLCKVGYLLKPRTGGWVNQNVWNAGGITQSPNTFTGPANKRPGYRHAVLDGTVGFFIHANTFVGASFEGDYSEYQLEFINAAENIFQGSTRFELGTATVGVTADSATDTITAPAGFGLSTGDPVVFLAITSVPGGITTRTVYWAVNVSGNTFQLSATRGGSVIDLTSNGSGLLAIRPPTLRYDNTLGNTKDNVIRDYNSYPGPLAVIRVGAAAPAAKSPIVG